MAENGVFVTVLSWAVFAVFGAACSGLFMGAFTQNAEILAGGTDYMWIVTVFSLGLFMSVTMERVLQVTGKTVYQMISQMTGAVVNIILDPVFIFGWLGLPAMGVAGAALATVIGQFCGMAVGIGINHVKNHEVRLNFRRFRPDWHSIKGIYQVGLPSIIMQSIGSVMTFGMNKILIAFTETAVSVFGVYFKLQSFVFMPVFGVTNALVPIVGYNYGARSSQRIQQATRLSLLMTTAIMALGTVIFQVAPGPLLSLFSASDTMLSIGIPALRIISVSFCFAGVAIVFSSVFPGAGRRHDQPCDERGAPAAVPAFAAALLCLPRSAGWTPCGSASHCGGRALARHIHHKTTSKRWQLYLPQPVQQKDPSYLKNGHGRPGNRGGRVFL
ncbi:MAG: MATE family efflux transporter [Ruthenibacterium lactatiformans]